MDKRTIKDLTIRDNFMFAAVMQDTDNCRQFLEMTLGFSIEKVIVDAEKSIIYHPEYRSVRLDVYAKDGCNTRYNVEMQVLSGSNLPKRSRYYHSQIDMELIAAGTDYDLLPDTYVIFICNFDPFGEGRYRYTYDMVCKETGKSLEDGIRTIFLNTRGSNVFEESEAMRNFLNYVKADLSESMGDFNDDYVRNLQESVHNIKLDREMGERYMLLKDLLKDERKLGRTEGLAEGRTQGWTEAVIELLSEFGGAADDILDTVMSESDPKRLSVYLSAAAKADSIEMFRKETGL